MADIVGEKPSFPILSNANLFFERKKIFTWNKRYWSNSLLIISVIFFSAHHDSYLVTKPKIEFFLAQETTFYIALNL